MRKWIGRLMAIKNNILTPKVRIKKKKETVSIVLLRPKIKLVT